LVAQTELVAVIEVNLRKVGSFRRDLHLSSKLEVFIVVKTAIDLTIVIAATDSA
jgi:hypothetical protein